MKELFTFVLLAALTLPVTAQTSELWGVNGERWDPRSRLPDFSFAGYHSGEAPIPNVPRGVSVKEFGAKGDGQTDDTAAFLKALPSHTRGCGLRKTGIFCVAQETIIDLPPTSWHTRRVRGVCGNRPGATPYDHASASFGT